MDALTTSTSLVAQWMMTRKLLENWIIWVAVDVVYIGMYIYKDLYVTSLLYAVFLVLSVMGYREWKKSFAARTSIPLPA
jgi:nicotinamide mononucleotide transporter